MTLLLVMSYISVCVYIHTLESGIARSYGSSVLCVCVCVFVCVCVCFNFAGNGDSNLFSRVISPICNLINSAQVFPFLYLFTKIVTDVFVVALRVLQ